MLSPSINPFIVVTGAPPIPEAQAWTRLYDGSRGPLVDLSQAVPGTAPHPEFLRRLAGGAGSPDGARYGPITGDAELRAAQAADLARTYEGRVEPGEVAVTAGCNMAFFVTMMLLACHGDAVLLPTPWYFNHQMTLAMLGIEARPLPCRPEAGFVPAIEDAQKLLDGSVRALVLVTPNNPTGAVYPAETIERFAAFCRREGIFLMLDETERDFLPAGTNRAHGLFSVETWRSTLIQLYSFSKAYAIPGHRTGTIVADAHLIEQAAKILDCIQICAPRPAQVALPWAIEGLREWREANRAEINRRAEVFRAAMAPLRGWHVDSAGAYFAYLRHPFPGKSAQDVAERLAAERGVLCLPGSYFGPGQETHLRVAFANVEAEVLAGLTERFENLGF